jgi:hypothetical protein
VSETTLWQRLLPLALGAAISPVLFLAQLAQLCRPGAPSARLRSSGAFLLGALLVVLAWGAAGGWIASRLPPHRAEGPDPAAAVVQLLLGLILASLALRIVILSPRGDHAREPLRQGRLAPDVQLPGTSPGRTRRGPAALLAPLLQGLGLMAINVSSLLLFLTATQDVGRSGQPAAMKLLAWVVLDACTLLPVWLPPALLLFSGIRGPVLLEALGTWVETHRRGIEAVVTAGFATFLIWRGLGDL